MALALYSSASETAVLSNDGSGETPFTVTFDGVIGGSIDKKLYIRNDSTNRWYENIVISIIDTLGENIVDGSVNGFSWKMAEKDIPLTCEEWALISPGNTLSFSANIGDSIHGDIATYLSFWIRVSIPSNQPVETIKDVVIRINATENAV